MTASQAHSQEKLDKILRQVQSLLAHAEDSGNTPEAQETYRQKAEALMFTYRIEENQLQQAGGAAADGIVPVWRTIWLCRVGSEFAQTYRYMASTAIDHVGGKAVVDYERNPDDGNATWIRAQVVGYESDLRYAELLYTSMHLGFAGKMEPRYDASKSDAENAYLMRSAGMEGRRIAAAIWGDDSKPNRVKARKMFAQYASSIGEDPSDLLGRGNNVKVYRESYAAGFESEMWRRLARMRQSHGDKEMILKGRNDAVQEALYARYPHLRPRPASDPRRTIGGRETCLKCQKAASGYCREHNYLKPRVGRYVERAYSAAGDARGRTAARSVDLGRKGTPRVSGGSGGATREIG